MAKQHIPIHRPKTLKDFSELNQKLNRQHFVALDILKSNLTKSVGLGAKDPSIAKANDMAECVRGGMWSSGPLAKVAWSFDARENTVVQVSGKDGKPMGLGYVKWGPDNSVPSTIPVLAQSSPYTAAPLRYIADLTAGLGPRLMYRFPDGTLCEFRDAGEILLRAKEEEEQQNLELDDDANPLEYLTEKPLQKQQKGPAAKAYEEWERTWLGYDDTGADGIVSHVPGAKEFLEDNNLDLHLTQCEQDDVMLDIYFPTVGFQRGRAKGWNPRIIRIGMLPAHSTRLEMMNEYRHIDNCYFSDQWRTLGGGSTGAVRNGQQNIVMYPACMPQHLLSDLRYIVESNQRTRIKDRPTWVVCPTFYPSGQKPYYPQPAWWSIFTSKAFDFSSTILYDKAQQRENSTTWGKIFYISLDYLDLAFKMNGIAGDKDAQLEFIGNLDRSVEDFLQHRENQGKMMRQFSFTTPDGKEHHNVEIVDVAETTNDAVKAGKEELELSTSPIFLGLQVDPRLVGVPMVAASNGGTALREMHLLKQQQLNVKQRLYLRFLNTICRFNQWSDRAEFHIVQQTLTTLDNSKTGTVETIEGERMAKTSHA